MKIEISEVERQDRIRAGDNEYLFVDNKGNVVLDIFYSYARKINDELSIIFSSYSDKSNIINMKTGKLLLKEWYYTINDYNNGYCCVDNINYGELFRKKPDTCGCNYINLKGKFMFKKWFNDATGFRNGWAMVFNDKDLYLMDINLNLKHCTKEDIIEYEMSKHLKV